MIGDGDGGGGGFEVTMESVERRTRAGETMRSANRARLRGPRASAMAVVDVVAACVVGIVGGRER